jgi:lactoylglutathione lyase
VVRTLHTAYRVLDLARALDFYTKVGFLEVGRVVIGDGSTLAMLRLPDDDVVTLELVANPTFGSIEIGKGFSHLVVQVDDLGATLGSLSAQGINYEEPQLPSGPEGPKTSFIRDPDGYRIELVEWPSGHADGITEADFRG